MSGSRGRVTLRQMRIARVGTAYWMLEMNSKDNNPKPCTEEINAYLDAVARMGSKGMDPTDLGQAITDCMDARSMQPRPLSLKFHMIEFMKRD